MKLSIADRLTVLQILPNEGDLTTIKIVRDLVDHLGFTEQEFKECNITIQDNQAHWDKEIEIEFEFGPKALSMVVTALEKLNKENKLTVNYLPVYEKFVGE
jgi:hypothetical protein